MFCISPNVMKDSLEWQFALEEYLHGRLLNLTECAMLYEGSRQ
jgi:hypothetical protein